MALIPCGPTFSHKGPVDTQKTHLVWRGYNKKEKTLFALSNRDGGGDVTHNLPPWELMETTLVRVLVRVI